MGSFNRPPRQELCEWVKQATSESYSSELQNNYGDLIIVFPNPDHPSVCTDINGSGKPFVTLGEELLDLINKGFKFNVSEEGVQNKRVFVRALGRAFDQMADYQ